MERLTTTDNNRGECQVPDPQVPDFQKIANRKISEIKIDNNEDGGDLLFFSNQKEKISNKPIFSLDGTKLTTYNMMGFVGLNDSELTIRSRFAQEENDYFLHYMLQKVFSINLFDLKHSSNQEDVFDFWLYLFPYHLEKALRQGLYKEYQKREYNDANIKGAVDVGRHIRVNMPFMGKMAYRAREHSYDNKITQLIRHTIEHIKKHKFAQGILTNDSDTKNDVSKIVQATSTYDKNQRLSVVNKNLKPLVHPYFSEYKELQKVCLQILRYEGLKYGKEKAKIYGLLFDGAWLWEEYLNTILKECEFEHPRNDISKGGIDLFKEPRSCKTKWYPDFWKKDFILDAKYKKLDKYNISEDDLRQIISYMYVKQSKLGGFIFPKEESNEVNEKSNEVNKIGILNGYGGTVKTWAFSIPQEKGSFKEFCEQISKNECRLKKTIINEEKAL